MYLDSVAPGSADAIKINFVVGYLEGNAQKWLTPYLVEEGRNCGSIPFLTSWNLFWQQVQVRFGEHNREEKYCLQLAKLRQRTDVQAYLSEFRRLAQPLGYNDTILRDMFYDGLKPEVHTMMMNSCYIPCQHTMEEVFQESLLIWEQLEAYRQLHPQHQPSNLAPKPSTLSHQNTTTPSTGTSTRVRFNRSDHVYRIKDGWAQKGNIEAIRRVNNMTTPIVKWNGVDKTETIPFRELKKDERPIFGGHTPAKPDPKGPGPMDLDGKGFSSAVCYHCGGKGHMAWVCPSKPLSGNEAKVEELKSDEEDSGKGKGQDL